MNNDKEHKQSKLGSTFKSDTLKNVKSIKNNTEYVEMVAS